MYRGGKRNIKKGYSSLDVGLNERFALIKRFKESYHVTTLCQTFDVHRRSYKYWTKRKTMVPPEWLKDLVIVKSIHEESKGSTGARSIATIATARGYSLSRYRVRGLMRAQSLMSCQLPNHRYKKATKEHVAIPNLLARQFDVTKPNEVWCGDVTYIWTGKRWGYLALVIDLFARKPVGWAINNKGSFGSLYYLSELYNFNGDVQC